MESPGRILMVRKAMESDLDDIEEMVDDFVKGHPAQDQPRPRAKLREAYFGSSPVAHLVVAVANGRAVGMAHWTFIYEMFWGIYGGSVEWLYVRPKSRGTGIVAAIVAQVCSEVRAAGGEFLYGGGGDEVEPLYERAAIGSPTHHCHLSAEAFQVFADLAGKPSRDIVRGLPSRELNNVAPVARFPPR